MAAEKDNNSAYDGKVEYGVLEKLIGTWEGQTGWNVIAVPALTKDEKKTFKLLVQNYYETLTFEAIEDPVLNEGGEVDQIVGAVKYTQEIHEFETNTLLHVETGMFFYLDNIKCNVGCGNPWTPPYSIARSGTIPHGNSIMLLGDPITVEGAVELPAISSYPNLPQTYLEQYRERQEYFSSEDIVTGATASKIFDVENPNYNLERDSRGLEILETTNIHVDSKDPAGLVNLPFINKYADTTWASADFWIQKVNLPMSNETYDQLQYSQIVDLEFEVNVNGVDKKVAFPHITTNTLKRKR